MDNIIAKYSNKKKNGLCYCEADGVAYQLDMSRSVEYDRNYFEKYSGYEVSDIGHKLNTARLAAVKPWANNLKTIDIGVGCGTFIKYALGNGLDVFGYDINPCAVYWLNKHECYDNPYTTQQKYFCFTFWDSLEHIPEPQKILSCVPLGAYVFVSIPIFKNLGEIIQSKHYRPDEHYYYFTALGLIRWLREYHFRLVQTFDFEVEAGREGIGTFLFEKTALKKKDISLLRDYFKEVPTYAKL